MRPAAPGAAGAAGSPIALLCCTVRTRNTARALATACTLLIGGACSDQGDGVEFSDQELERIRAVRLGDDALPPEYCRRAELPWAAGFLASRAFVSYRRGGGVRRSPLPDFYIGAHAAIAGFDLLTRDARRYRQYFPTVRVIAP